MEIAALVLLGLVAIGVWNVSGALTRIREDNAKFLPPDPEERPPARIEVGDVLRFDLLGQGVVLRAVGVEDKPDGSFDVTFAPVEP